MRPTTKHASGTTLARVLFAGADVSQPLVTNLEARGDAAGSVVTRRVGVSRHHLVADAMDDQAVLALDSVEGLADGDLLLIQPQASGDGGLFIGTIDSEGVDAEEKTVELAANLTAPLAKGARVYKLSGAAGTILVGNATKSFAPSNPQAPIIAGVSGMPLTLEINGTSSVAINMATVVYV